jgi:hypothetical protein
MCFWENKDLAVGHYWAPRLAGFGRTELSPAEQAHSRRNTASNPGTLTHHHRTRRVRKEGTETETMEEMKKIELRNKDRSWNTKRKEHEERELEKQYINKYIRKKWRKMTYTNQQTTPIWPRYRMSVCNCCRSWFVYLKSLVRIVLMAEDFSQLRHQLHRNYWRSNKIVPTTSFRVPHL